MSTKRLSPAAVIALKEALSSIYWYKNDLRSFISNCTATPDLVASLDWGKYKRQIVSDYIDELIRDQGKHIESLTQLCYDVSNMNDFSHLRQLEEGDEKVRKARESVSQLKTLVAPHRKKKQEEEDYEKRRKERLEELRQNKAIREKLNDLNTNFRKLAIASNPQSRGFELERLMYDLFELFDLDPKASFRNIGEQIDGAFTLEGTDYLFEAKWQREAVGIQSLDSFASKVQRKLDNTLGLFLSVNGFSPDGVEAHSQGRPSVILMDGADLTAVLEERIDFVTLILRKKRHASQTGNIFLQIKEINVHS